MSKPSCVLCLGCMLLMYGCSSKPPADADEAAASAPVSVAEAKRQDIQQLISVEAILYPRQQANIVPKISAPVAKFLAQRGDHVKKGQLLAVLEHQDLAAASQESEQLYQQAEAAYRTTVSATMPDDLTKSQTDVQATKQTFEAAQNAYQAREALYQQGAIAKRQVEDARTALAQAQAQYATAQQHLQSLQSVSNAEQKKSALAQMQAAKAHYQGSAAQLAYAEVRAPIDGVVSDRPANIGEMANSGSSLLSIVDISRVSARAVVSLQQAASVHVGDAATISEGPVEVPGKVTVVSPAVDPNTTTVQVWVEAANPKERLKLGASVQIAIEAGTVKNALVIPATALLSSDDGGDRVMVAGTDSMAHERAVKTGIRSGDSVQILNGLQPGEKVITEGALGLDDKSKIQVGETKGKGEKEEDDKDKDANK